MGAGLAGRKILIISPRFFGYEKRIADRLVGFGAEVVIIDDRPKNNFFTKAIIRINPWLIQPKLDKYHESQINLLQPNGFDIILIISPEGCGFANIGRYKKAFPTARTLLYMWDSFENKSHEDVPALLALFDATYSFDPEDCKRYGMRFRPLFFTAQPEAGLDEHAGHEHGYRYDFSFVGTIHSDRFRILKRLLKNSGGRYNNFIFAYLPSWLHYWAFKVFKREFWGVPRSTFQFAPLAYPEVLRVMRESAAVVDIEHPRQRGLTMRTLEVVGAGKKLITTNRNIVHYPFYSPGRVQILDRKDPSIQEGFFETKPDPLPNDVLSAYSLDGWIEEIMSAEEALFQPPSLANT